MISTNDEEIFFDRYSAAQNTFFVGNLFRVPMKNFWQGLADPQKIRLTQHLCRGIYDQKTDGLLLLKPKPGFDFEWEFYNSDGSSAEMCGNAARCAALSFYVGTLADGRQHTQDLRFLTIAGDVGAEVISRSRVKIEMPKIIGSEKVTVDGQVGVSINTGVPHFVIERAPDRETGKKFRSHPFFGKSGTNVTFLERSDSQTKAVTFERGVEDFTQACGTGAVAAAFVCALENHIHHEQSIEMPGGVLCVANLGIDLRPLLTGDVQHDYRMSKFLDFKKEDS